MQAGVAFENGWHSPVGLPCNDAIKQWRHWLSRTLVPLDVQVHDADSFTAQWRCRDLGQLQFVEMEASAQCVTHGTGSFRRGGAGTFQLVYSRRGTFATDIGKGRFGVRPGEFVILDNSRFYEMDMDDFHQAIDLVMPQSWLERWLPDPSALLNRPLSAREGWGRPIGGLLEAAAENLECAVLPRHLISDQIGSLLSLLIDEQKPVLSRHRALLARRIFQIIEQHYDDPEMTLDTAVRELGISKRYVHALLAEQGTSFIQTLNRVRIEQAAQMLTDPRFASLQIGEIALRSGFLDSGYFTRIFRKRFAMTPRAWREQHLPG
jgi:AraC-like DNA-binding protein